jgi:ubiquinone/menaquinone biosynthesis C-methylase UbiE
MKEYSTIIERGRDKINDDIFDYLLPRLNGKVLDIGCNTGYLLSVYKGESRGVDASSLMVAKAVAKGLDVIQADACKLPFENKVFDTVVLSCVLEQIEDWKTALKEAMRVGKTIIGFNPIPKSDQWGFIQGSVKSVIDTNEMLKEVMLNNGLSVVHFDNYIKNKYYFEIVQL